MAEGLVESDLIVDTNVVFDLVSIKHLVDSFEEHLANGTDLASTTLADLKRENARVFARLHRLGWTLVFFWFARTRGLQLGSYTDELAKMVKEESRNVPKDDIAYVFWQISAKFLLVEVFSPLTIGGLVSDEIPPGVVGNAADDALLDVAARDQLPLITHEGWSHTGEVKAPKGSLRLKAIERAVAVFTAREYVERKGGDVESLRAGLLKRFDELAQGYIARLPGNGNARRKALALVYRTYALAMSEDVLQAE